MDFDLFLKVCYVIVPALLGLGGYFIKDLINRLEKLETQADDFITKEELRETLTDRIEPIREDISDIKQKLDKLYDFLLHK